jgi:hypothetical protein
MFRTSVIAFLGFIAGTVITYLAVIFGTLLVWQWLGIHDQDGGGHMALALVIAPFFALIGGIVGAVLVRMLASRHRRNAPPSADDKRRDKHRFFLIGGAIAGGITGHYAAQFGFWLVSPIRFDSYWKVWAISWVPTIVAMFGALAGGLFVRRMISR